MKKENRGGVPLAGLTVAAILLASTAGYVSALSRMFQAPMISEESETGFLSADADTAAPAAKIPAANFEQSLGRMAAAWLVNALPSYSSGRARELWYLSLDSSADRQLRFENSGSYNSYSPVRSDLASFNQSSSVAPVSGFVSAQTIPPSAPANTGSTISWSGLGTNNSWTTAANWTGGVAPANDLTTDLALFNLTTYPRQPTANSVSIAGIRVGDGSTATAALTISGSGTGLAIGADGIIIFANAGATTLSAVTTIGAAQSWTNNSSNTFTKSGAITYSNLLTLNGGSFTFGGTTTSTTGAGGVKITNNSTVIDDSTGPIFGTGTLELNSGTFKSSNSSTRSLANVVSITGDFTFDAVSSGINEFTGGGSTTGNRLITVNTVTTRFVTNPFTLGGNLTTAGNGRLNFQAGLNLGGADRTITAGATGVGGNQINGAVDSSAAGNKLILGGNNFSIGTAIGGVTPGATNVVNFDVNATGTITFGGANTFLGSVTVEAGTVNVTNDSGLGSSTAATAGLFMTPSSGTATVNFTSLTPAIASLSSSGAGTSNVVLGNTGGTPSATTLTVGGNNATTTFAGSISDKSATNAAAIGSFTKAGSGLLLLTGTNTYTGATTVAAGELFLGSSGSLLSTSTIRLGDTIANSPSAMFTFGSTSGGITLANPMTVQASASGTEGTRTLLGLAEGGNTNTYSGVVTMNTGLTVQSAATGGSVTNGQGILLFQGGSINVGTSTLTVNSNLRGNNADTYSIQGIVTINELLSSSSATGGSVFKDGSGTLILQGTSNNYTGTSAGALNANGMRIGGGVLAIYGDGSLGLAPTTATNNVFFVAPGTNTNVDSIAPTLRADAGGITLSATRMFNIGSGVSGRIVTNGNTFTVAGVINGPGNLAKTGAGTLILSGNNTYTGTTTVSAGTLLVNGNQSAATGAMTVNNSGTTLGGNGVIGASLTTVNSGANLAPGSSTGILTTGSVTLNSGSNFVLELNNTTPGTGYDQLVVNGSVTLNTGNIVVIAGGGLNAGDKFFVVVNDGVDPVVGAFAQGATVTSGGDTFLINYLDDSNGGLAGNDISLTLQAIPEPSTWIGAALALAAIGFTQRRRLRSLVAPRT